MKKIFGEPKDHEATLAARKSAGLPFTPLEELDKAVKGFFARGPEDASRRFQALQSSVLSGDLVVELDDSATSLMDCLLIQRIPWNSCKLAATLVLLLACPAEPELMFKALEFLSRSLGGLPTMETISNNASADLSKRFAQAKKAAIDGKIGKVTVLGVNLVDVEMLERGEKKSCDMLYTSFAHSFVVAVGREGFRIYQAWGEHGYRLDEYLKRGHSRCRDWVEGKKFVKTFDKLARYQVWPIAFNHFFLSGY